MRKPNAVEQYIDNWLNTEGCLDAGDTDSLKRFMKGLGNEIDKLSIAPLNSGKK